MSKQDLAVVLLEAEDLGGGVYWSIWRGGERIGGARSLFRALHLYLKDRELSCNQSRTGGEFVACGPILEWCE